MKLFAIVVLALVCLTGCGTTIGGRHQPSTNIAMTGDVPVPGQIVCVLDTVNYTVEDGLEGVVTWRPYVGGDNSGEGRVRKLVVKGFSFHGLQGSKGGNYFVVRDSETTIDFHQVHF